MQIFYNAILQNCVFLNYLYTRILPFNYFEYGRNEKRESVMMKVSPRQIFSKRSLFCRKIISPATVIFVYSYQKTSHTTSMYIHHYTHQFFSLLFSCQLITEISNQDKVTPWRLFWLCFRDNQQMLRRTIIRKKLDQLLVAQNENKPFMYVHMIHMHDDIVCCIIQTSRRLFKNYTVFLRKRMSLSRGYSFNKRTS